MSISLNTFSDTIIPYKDNSAHDEPAICQLIIAYGLVPKFNLDWLEEKVRERKIEDNFYERGLGLTERVEEVLRKENSILKEVLQSSYVIDMIDKMNAFFLKSSIDKTPNGDTTYEKEIEPDYQYSSVSDIGYLA